MTQGAAPAYEPEPGDALLLVDVQRDFLPGGALGVSDGDAVVPLLNRLLRRFAERGLPIFATRDWHPANHCSFQPRGGPWPPHCIQGTAGAGFADMLVLPERALIVSKASDAERDAYSGFDDTELAGELRAAGCRRLFVGGLATDYCVLNTVLDARKAGFEVLVLVDAVRAVDLAPGDGARALARMYEAGAVGIDEAQVA